MAVKYYDEAIHALISSWVPNQKIRVLKPNEVSELFRLNADLNNDNTLTLPLIALSRDTNIEIKEVKKTLLSFRGKTLYANDEEQVITLNAIPIHLGYQIDIYTKNFDECDAYVREFVFGFVNNPVIKITLPYNGVNLQLQANIRLNSTITDNSDITERLFRDQFTRFTLQLEVLDAYLYSLPTPKTWHVTDSDTELRLIKLETNIVEDIENI